MMGSVGGSYNYSSRSSGASYAIMLATPFDLQAMEDAAAQGLGPRHFLYRVQQKLGATVLQPGDVAPSALDRVAGRLISSPEQWAVARSLVSSASSGDVVFAHDNDGLVLALIGLLRRKRLRILLSTMSPGRGRFRLLAGRLQLWRRIDRFLVNSADKAAALTMIGVPAERIWVRDDQTDTEFFTPGPMTRTSERPMLFAAGREQRDYRTLGTATADLDVDVEICAASPNASDRTAVTYPDPIPDNMTFGPYPWPQFVQAYRDADIVVLPLLDNDYSAGLTVAMEAMACQRPVVASAVPGAVAELIAEGLVVGCRVGDPEALRRAIVELLDDPERRAELAKRGHERVLSVHRSDQLVDDVVSAMQALAAG
jgi:glycosyltransferase involved in cell wall biosynthesis